MNGGVTQTLPSVNVAAPAGRLMSSVATVQIAMAIEDRGERNVILAAVYLRSTIYRRWLGINNL